VKFAVSVSQSEPVKKLEAFAEANKETQGKFTIGDEKVRQVTTWFWLIDVMLMKLLQKHNVFMMVDVCCSDPPFPNSA
jgi:hypothetical protein